jgi:hypothetical protein
MLSQSHKKSTRPRQESVCYIVRLFEDILARGRDVKNEQQRCHTVFLFLTYHFPGLARFLKKSTILTKTTIGANLWY